MEKDRLLKTSKDTDKSLQENIDDMRLLKMTLKKHNPPITLPL